MSVLDVVSVGGVAAAAVALVAVANRIEPHRAGRDLQTFRGLARRIQLSGKTERWRDAFTTITSDGVEVRFRGLRGEPARGPVVNRADGPNKRAYTYAVSGDPIVELRVPRSSKVVAELDAIIR